MSIHVSVAMNSHIFLNFLWRVTVQYILRPVDKCFHKMQCCGFGGSVINWPHASESESLLFFYQRLEEISEKNLQLILKSKK
jgi:hypothetical protein